MSFQAVVTLSVAISGSSGLASTYTPPAYPLTNPSAPGGVPQPYALTSGNNTIAVPTGAIGYVVVPPTGSTNAKVLADTGAGSSGITFAALPVMGQVNGVSVYINATAGETVEIAWF